VGLLHPSVSDAWPALAREHEGVCPYPYLDTVAKVTVGIGTLMDDGTGTPPAPFLALPWTIDGRAATRAEVSSGWLLVKSRTDLAPKGGGAFRDITKLRIDAKVIDGLLMAKTREFWSVLSAQLPGLERWPADAQLALLDMSYQLGPRFMGTRWPNFTAAAHAEDFAGCAAHCAVRQASAARNDRRKRLFTNAACVVELGIDPAILWDARTPEETMATERLTPPYPVGAGRTCICMIKALPLVEYRFAQKGWIQEDFSGLVTQWGYQNNAVDASSTTHNGGGCFDVRYTLVDTDAKLIVWQECGFTPFRRRLPQWRLSKHGHVLVSGCPHLDPAAAAQIADYRIGRNGLASHGAYDGPTGIYRTWRRAQEIYAKLIDEEINMPSLNEIRAVVSEELAQALRERELINNVGFESGTEDGEPNRYVTINEALISMQGRLAGLPGRIEAADEADEVDIKSRLAKLEQGQVALGRGQTAILEALGDQAPS
jgi:GH24 family phage-related lysozyme (muramidase)